jgi:VWFA-related protein
MNMRGLRAFCIPALLMAAAAPLTWGQSTPSPDAPPVSNFPSTPPPSTQIPTETLHVTSNLVTEYFTVRDKHNALIPYLTENACTVWENKQQQKITSFQAEADQPLTLGILVDTSGSQEYVLPLEQQSAERFLKRVLRPKDQAFVLSFDVGVNLEQDYTNNVAELDQAINKVQINTASGGGSMGVPGLGQGPVPTMGAPKGTLLYDAVYEASRDKMQGQTGRKALILLTDGEDEGSQTRLRGAIDAAENANAIVYVILIADRGFYADTMMGYTGDAAMRRLTEATGGRVINVGNNGKKLEDAFEQIEEELRTQYVLQYVPTDKNMDGSFRRVDVFCQDNGQKLKVQGRKGYFAVSQPDGDSGN